MTFTVEPYLVPITDDTKTHCIQRPAPCTDSVHCTEFVCLLHFGYTFGARRTGVECSGAQGSGLKVDINNTIHTGRKCVSSLVEL